jgi:hypothetical protein
MKTESINKLSLIIDNLDKIKNYIDDNILSDQQWNEINKQYEKIDTDLKNYQVSLFHSICVRLETMKKDISDEIGLE